MQVVYLICSIAEMSTLANSNSIFMLARTDKREAPAKLVGASGVIMDY